MAQTFELDRAEVRNFKQRPYQLEQELIVYTGNLSLI
jgi:hypothetical protein